MLGPRQNRKLHPIIMVICAMATMGDKWIDHSFALFVCPVSLPVVLARQLSIAISP